MTRVASHELDKRASVCVCVCGFYFLIAKKYEHMVDKTRRKV